jgi:hypothetical protein
VFDALRQGAHRGALRDKGGSWSRCVRRRATWSAASVGSSLARLGVNASRSLATVSGWTGKRTRQS